jgi:cytidylate kinase
MKDLTFEQVHSDMQFRDKNDSSRAFAPLSRANDATLLDTTNLSLQESIETVRRIIMRKLKLSGGDF